ncbi:MAG: class I SAM-dependent methyltransferase [Bacillaceae bacterium]|nr:class I SAM-dependent methyltransferase [Bacillaceae bacterium]
MIVSTSTSAPEPIQKTASDLAQDLNAPYIYRDRKTLAQLFQDYEGEPLLIVTSEGLKAYGPGNRTPLFFHPGMSKVRIKRLLKGDNDRMIEACQLQKGDRFLDATLGMAADSIVAAHVVGEEGSVTGLEAVQILSAVVSRGLQEYQDSLKPLQEAMRRIKVIQTDALTYLKKCPDHYYDVIYFDPMFRETVEKSTPIAPLRSLARGEPLTVELIEEARRVARRRVVLKERKKSGEFERLGFDILDADSNASFTYGIIRL